MDGLERIDLGNDCWVSFLPRFVTEHETCMATLLQELELSQPELLIFGRRYPTPRETAWYGDPDARYRYSGKDFEPLLWTPRLQSLRESVSNFCGHHFNGVLVNHYRYGKDSMGWHADDEAEIGPSVANRLVASLSLGGDRRFLLRSKSDKSQRHVFYLGGGSLFVMGGRTQTFFEHAIPKTQKSCTPRLNLTFRVIRH